MSNTRHWRGDLFKAKPDSTGGGADDPVIDVLCLQVTAELDSIAQRGARGAVKNPVFQIQCESGSVAIPSPLKVQL